MKSLIVYLKRLLGIRSPEENFAAGVYYVNGQVEKFGKDNKEQMDRLWAEADQQFEVDRSDFDRGVVHRLKELKIEHPLYNFGYDE